MSHKDKEENKKVQQHYLQENMRTDSEANPSMKRSKDKQGDTLRTKAAQKLHGEDGENPSQLGDPIGLKAETSERVPTDEAGSTSGTTLRDSEDDNNEASWSSRQSKL
jgi:hypothetical protein